MFDRQGYVRCSKCNSKMNCAYVNNTSNQVKAFFNCSNDKCGGMSLVEWNVNPKANVEMIATRKMHA